jgi:hypothetical protein
MTDTLSRASPRRAAKACLLVASVALWTACVGAGFLWLLDYSMTPGRAGATPTSWPAESRIQRVAGSPTLVMFAHPLCPCSRASVAELADLLRRTGPMTAHVLMLAPDGAGPEWADRTLWDAAAEIKGVTVSADENGAEARRFGAATSGHVVIYSAEGRLVFSGGITAARGHVGDNLGLERAVASLRADGATCGSSPVFGCGLREPR